MTTRAVLRIPFAAIALLAVACGARDDALDDLYPDGAPTSVVVRVNNQTSQQATVYMIQDRGLRMRIGVVPSHSERYFEQEMRLGRTVEFDVRLLAGRTHRTSAVPAVPGDTIVVDLPPHL